MVIYFPFLKIEKHYKIKMNENEIESEIIKYVAELGNIKLTEQHIPNICHIIEKIDPDELREKNDMLSDFIDTLYYSYELCVLLVDTLKPDIRFEYIKNKNAGRCFWSFLVCKKNDMSVGQIVELLLRKPPNDIRGIKHHIKFSEFSPKKQIELYYALKKENILTRKHRYGFEITPIIKEIMTNELTEELK
jgi:hypothetical protein